MVIDVINITINIKYEVACELSIDIQIWPWSILNMEIKHISTVNISKMVKDRANMTSSINYDVIVNKFGCIFFPVNKFIDL